MVKVGFVGWRGMVGSVLRQRMLEENDFQGLKPLFFSTSQVGQKGPEIGMEVPELADAFDIKTLSSLDAIVTCQGGDYTKEVYPKLRKEGWDGYWIDAASALRMEKDSVIVLDPVNREVIDEAFESGVKNYIGANCTVSLMLMGIGGLFKENKVDWLTSMTYQSASGAGSKNMAELVEQMQTISKATEGKKMPVLELDREVQETIENPDFPTENFTVPLACNLIPWIDKEVEDGQSREEWKGSAETNKILNSKQQIPVDGICVRVPAMRCHSQAITIKLKEEMELKEIENTIAKANEWVKVIPNNKEDSIRQLTPIAVSGKLTVPVGRIRHINNDASFVTLFTVGDQLLWGAAEPVRRMLQIVLKKIS
ncbi:MAG: aspartate-semialdehyde dehydrogenase [Candidatus Diapherotrites archaeon]|uniref:Aspartate-semialdehyde dehydrogenase n=1 Tax=Candidatus Iainarchaeum sp. TaxID=3101447 RepID=A0A2D6M1K2_9ARCH|nr:aspartate-semialdehyde dehydrogenase [Candidatus Diapherotrites archaeon]